MRFRPAGLAGSYLIEVEPISDERGSFARIWDEAEFVAHGLDMRNVQTNMSKSRRRGTIRGLHYQVPPNAESKLLRCTRGAVFDVAVDMRSDSPTYGQWQGHRVEATSNVMVFVPAGCAHGYQALEDHAEVSYQVSARYDPGAERGVRWDDPSIGIGWPIVDDVTVSDKDRAWPDVEVEVRA